MDARRGLCRTYETRQADLAALLRHGADEERRAVAAMRERGYAIDRLAMGEQPLLCHLYAAARVCMYDNTPKPGENEIC